MLSDTRTYTGDNRLVVALRLSIRLRMTGSREHVNNDEEATQCAEELLNKFLAAVGHHVGGDPIVEDPPMEESARIGRFRHGSERGCLRQLQEQNADN